MQLQKLVAFKKFPRKITQFLFLIFTSMPIGCTKSIEVGAPTTQIVGQNVYESNSSAAAVLTGIYSRMMGSQGLASGSTGVGLIAGLSADELTNYSPDPGLSEIYINDMVSSNVPFWNEAYSYIYTVNAALEGIGASSKISQNVKNQLTGEAQFCRAFFYLYLVNFFGDIPLILTTSYQTNQNMPRTEKTLVYNQIVLDLQAAKSLLNENYLASDAQTNSNERVRPTKWAATALLARAYLYLNQFDSAETESTEIINNAGLFSLCGDLDSVFLSNSSEAIWQLQPDVPGYNTFDGYTYILTTVPNYTNPVSLSSNLLNSFESADNRYTHWVDSFSNDGQTYYYFPFKYKVQLSNTITEYLMVMRLAEQFLIRAEARVKQGNLAGALSDLNTIRGRAGINPVVSQNANSIFTLILHERQVELFTEWGHRWLDMKRTSSIDSIMSIVTPEKGGIWNTEKQLYPIPLTDIQADNMLTQNPGYN